MNERPGGGMVHPVPILAILTLLVNDHWGKYAVPGWVTGKLSDAAGLVFFPLLAQAVVELLRRGRPDRRALVGAVVLTGLAFTLVKTVPAVTVEYAEVLRVLQSPWAVVGPWRSRAVTDPTDLLALPALAVPLSLGWRRSARSGSQDTGPGADRAGGAG